MAPTLNRAAIRGGLVTIQRATKIYVKVACLDGSLWARVSKAHARRLLRTIPTRLEVDGDRLFLERC